MPERDSAPAATDARDLRPAFLAAADHVVAILRRDVVTVAWHQPSAAGWSNGGRPVTSRASSWTISAF